MIKLIVTGGGPVDPEPVWDTLTLEQLQEWVELALEAEGLGEVPPGCPACAAEVETIATRPLSFRPPFRNSATLLPCGCTY